jgi:hypothetical protein
MSSFIVTGGAMASLSLVPESSATWQPPTAPHMAVVTTLDQPGFAYELTTSDLSYASSELTTEIYTSWPGLGTVQVMGMLLILLKISYCGIASLLLQTPMSSLRNSFSYSLGLFPR